MDPVLGGIIGGGLKLLGGLFGSKKKTTTSTVDYESMVRRAQAAGFNPLTALRNGGSSGFAVTTTSGDLSSGEAIADALGAGFDTFYNMRDANAAAEVDRLKKDILQEELRALQANSAVVRDRNFGYSIPHTVTQSDEVLNAVPSLSASSKRSGGRSRRSDSKSAVKGDGLEADYQLYTTVYDKNTGRVFDVLNPDLMDMDFRSIAASTAMLGAADAVQNHAPPLMSERPDGALARFDAYNAEQRPRRRAKSEKVSSKAARDRFRRDFDMDRTFGDLPSLPLFSPALRTRPLL